MRITKENYEVFFIDYFDGRLSKEMQEELMRFLETHPDLKEEFEAFDDSIALSPDPSIGYPDKAALKKNKEDAGPSKDDYKEWFIAYHEGDLTSGQESGLIKFLEKNAGLKSEFELFGRLPLKPDGNITYDNKATLKHKSGKPGTALLSYLGYAAAAAVLIVAGLFWLHNEEKPLRNIETVSSIPHVGIKQIEKGPVYENAPIIREESKSVEIDKPATIQELMSKDRLSQLASIEVDPAAFNVEPIKKINRRYEQTSQYYYQTVQLDLEYYAKVIEYTEKNFAQRLVYRLKNKVIPTKDYYVTDPGFSPLNILGIGTGRLDELASADAKQDNSGTEKVKSYRIKTGLFEFFHKRTPRHSSSDNASE